MRKIAEILKAKAKCEEDITLERKKGAGNRDKAKIRGLQSKHKSLTAELSKAHEDDRVTPKDKGDDSEKGFKDETEKERQKKVKDWQEKNSKEESKQA